MSYYSVMPRSESLTIYSVFFLEPKLLTLSLLILLPFDFPVGAPWVYDKVKSQVFFMWSQHKSNFQLVLYTIEYICNSIPIWSFAFPAAECPLYPSWFYYPFTTKLSLIYNLNCHDHCFSFANAIWNAIIFVIGKNVKSYSNLNTSASLKNIIQFGIQAYTFFLLFNCYVFQNPDTLISLIHKDVIRDFLTTIVAYVLSNHLI